MQILNQAAKAAHKSKLSKLDNADRYSRYPVHEAAFWESVFAAAKSPKYASKVLDEIEEIEGEPCIENDRVWRNVNTARHLAKLTLLS